MSKKLKALKQKADQLIEEQNWDELIPLQTEIISLETNQETRAEGYYRRGFAYDIMGDSNRAIEDYNQAIKCQPDHAEAYFQRGTTYISKGDYDRAIADFDQATKYKPDHATAYYLRGTAHTSKGDLDRAIADFDQAIKYKPDYAEAYFSRGRAYSVKGDPDRAIADYDQAIKHRPDFAVAYFSRGNAYSIKGDTDRAIADYDQTIKHRPDYADAYFSRGNAYIAKRDFDRAIADYDQVIKHKPTFVWAHYSRGLAYSAKGDYDRAVENYNQAIKCQPDFALAYYSRGFIYSAKGDYDRAIVDFDQAIKYQPDFAVAYYSRGLEYNRKGDFDRAIADYDQAIKYQPNYAAAYHSLVRDYVSKRDFDQAIVDFDQAVKYQPSYAEVYYQRGRAYASKRDHERAIQDFDQAIKYKPDYVEAYYSRGFAYFVKSDFERAIQDFLSAGISDLKQKFANPLSYIAHQIDAIFRDEEVEKRAGAFVIYVALLAANFAIKAKLFCKPQDYDEVAHYTSLHVLKNLANKSPFRLYNAAYMNDPEEGRVFFGMMKEKFGVDVEEIFYKSDSRNSQPSPAYIVSFVKVDKSLKDKDNLFLWRTYGKHNNEEAAGTCLIFKRDNPSFVKEMPGQIGPMEQLGLEQLVIGQSSAEQLSSKQLPMEKANSEFKMPLYKIAYKSECESTLQNEMQILKVSLQAIKAFHDSQPNENEDVKKSLAKLTRELLDDIRFLFKADYYKEENEVRVVLMRYNKEDGTPSKLDIEQDLEQTPPSFYWKTPENFRFNEVILGPRTKSASKWKQWIKWHNPNLTVERSGIIYGEDNL